MRILIAIGSNEIGGAEKQALILADQLSKLGEQVEIVFLRRSRSNKNFSIEHSYAKRIFCKFPKNISLPRYWTEFLKLAFYLRRKNFDVIHSFLPEATILISIYKLLLRASTIHVAGVRGEFIGGLKVKQFLYKKFLKQSDSIICNSQSLRDLCINKYGVLPEKIKAIPNGVAIAPRREIKPNQPLKAIIVANLQPYKGYDLLFSCLSQIPHNIEIHVIGRGNFLECYNQEIGNLPGNVNIVFRGEIRADEIYSEFDFAIHPSRSEGLSNAILEELAHQLPVIAFNVGGNSELIVTQKNGLLLDNVSSEALREAINLFLENPHFIQQLAENTQSSVSQYTSERMSMENLRIYRNLTQ